jgi:ABC-type phosphate/phosphonate transport system substrate-binding protein
VSAGPHLIAELGMYPFASVRWAWDALWEALRERVDWLPAELEHSGDVHARWDDPQCVVNHMCGWPLARWHVEDQRVLGAFSITIPEAESYRYRSTLVSRHNVALADLVAADVRVVANSVDSLSGWISLLNATVGVHDAFPGHVRFSSAHVESLRALTCADADLACIDSWSLALIEREWPEVMSGLHQVGLGPWIPTPAVTVRHTVPVDDGELFAAALCEVLAEDASAPVREALLIDGFTRLTIDDYLPVLDLRSHPS